MPTHMKRIRTLERSYLCFVSHTKDERVKFIILWFKLCTYAMKLYTLSPILFFRICDELILCDALLINICDALIIILCYVLILCDALILCYALFHCDALISGFNSVKFIASQPQLRFYHVLN